MARYYKMERTVFQVYLLNFSCQLHSNWVKDQCIKEAKYFVSDIESIVAVELHSEKEEEERKDCCTCFW